jgi:hypothetical protein
MANEPHDLTVRYLRSIDEKLNRVAEDVREIKTRVDILKQQDAPVSNRIDHIDARMERIERRTGLVETT